MNTPMQTPISWIYIVISSIHMYKKLKITIDFLLYTALYDFKKIDLTIQKYFSDQLT